VNKDIVMEQTTQMLITQLMNDYSIEIHPKLTTKIQSFQDYLPPNSPVFITFIPGNEYQSIVNAAQRLINNNMHPIPHIEDYVVQLYELGVTEVLVIAVDLDQPKGPYESTLPILESGILEKHGMKVIDVGGHPEGNGDIPTATLDESLRYKNQLAHQSNAQYQVVTQFAFKAKPIIEWEKRIRAFNELPIRIGLAGPTKLKSLIHYAKISGIGPSLKTLTRNPLNYFRLATTSTPAPLIADIAEFVNQDPDTCIQAFHFYSFGGFKRTANWLNAVKNGDFEMYKLRSGFQVNQQ